MERDIFDTIKEKEFSALTLEERTELGDVCSSEFEYNQLKSVLSQVEVLKEAKPQPKKETKAKLDDLFVQTYPKVAPIWYNGLFAVVIPKDKPIYRQPLAQIAAVALLAFLTVPFLNQSITQETTQLAEVKKEVKQKSTDTNGIQEDVMEMETSTDAEQDVNIHQNGAVEISEKPILVASAVISPNAKGSLAFSSMEEATAPGSNHPDGVFMGDHVSFSQPASESPGIFDLLTTSF